MNYSIRDSIDFFFFFFQAEDGIRDGTVTGVQTCALPISLLRKEGIYSSMLANWRKQRTRGDFRSAAAAPKRGRKPDPALAAAHKNQQLQREIDLLRRRLAQAQEIIEVQKKLCTLLGLPTAEAPQETD